MSSSKTTLKTAVTKFRNVTGADQKTAERFLKASSNNLELAVNSYFSSTSGSSQLASNGDALGKLFEKYRENTDDTDIVSVNGVMKYLTDLGVNLENVQMLVPLEIVQAPSVSELSKEGFVEGWKLAGAETISKQKAYVAGQTKQLATDMALFKKVYRYTFILAKEKGQKAIAIETAFVFWDLLFTSPGKPWVTESTDFLSLWKEFLSANWTKTVNKDMWNQTYEFFLKSVQDETLGFWSEDGAWPGVIDEFVAYAKEKRGDAPVTMETD